MEEDNKILQADFEAVRATYFPEWDKDNNWSISLVHKNTVADGECIVENKNIEIYHFFENMDKHHLVLIHEICHAVLESPSFLDNHEEDWQELMANAAAVAKSLGKEVLSDMLSEEVTACRDGDETSAEDIYDEIINIVMNSFPNITPYKSVLDYFRRERHLSEYILNSEYPRCKAVYEKAVADVERAKEARKKHNI